MNPRVFRLISPPNTFNFTLWENQDWTGNPSLSSGVEGSLKVLLHQPLSTQTELRVRDLTVFTDGPQVFCGSEDSWWGSSGDIVGGAVGIWGWPLRAIQSQHILCYIFIFKSDSFPVGGWPPPGLPDSTIGSDLQQSARNRWIVHSEQSPDPKRRTSSISGSRLWANRSSRSKALDLPVDLRSCLSLASLNLWKKIRTSHTCSTIVTLTGPTVKAKVGALIYFMLPVKGITCRTYNVALKKSYN